ncbi:hypothetical protein S245_020065 [Arachis hypogaea]
MHYGAVEVKKPAKEFEVHPYFNPISEALGVAPIPGAAALAGKLNHQGIDAVSLSQIKEGFSFQGTCNHCISFR